MRSTVGVGDNEDLTLQMAGAFGEKSVEAELLRRGWMPANVNATVKNAAGYDIYAKKGPKTVHLRIKACRPGQGAFRWGFKPDHDITVDGIESTDFTILVCMGANRSEDQFIVLPTRVVRTALRDYRNAYIATPKKTGDKRIDPGNWTLRLANDKSGRDRPDQGFREKWTAYIENWILLEGA